MQNHEKIITGQLLAQATAAQLIAASAWFSLTPLPDDQWRFEVKCEPRNIAILEGLPGGVAAWGVETHENEADVLNAINTSAGDLLDSADAGEVFFGERKFTIRTLVPVLVED